MFDADGSWNLVVNVRIEDKPLDAYNLTIADFHTYFVKQAANDYAEPLWVHNNCLPNNEAQLKHIFRDNPGHLPDTPENRQLVSDIASEQNNFAGNDRFGNQVYLLNRSDGSQVWVYTRNGVIQNGGINNPAIPFVAGYGLKRSPP